MVSWRFNFFGLKVNVTSLRRNWRVRWLVGAKGENRLRPDVVGLRVKRSKGGNKFRGGVDAEPASVEVFCVARDNPGRVGARGGFMEHGILVVWEVQLEGGDNDRMSDRGDCEHGENLAEVFAGFCGSESLPGNVVDRGDRCGTQKSGEPAAVDRSEEGGGVFVVWVGPRGPTLRPAG